MQLQDKVCVVTGAGSGIGRATALGLARGGARVVLVGRTETRLAAVVAEIRGFGGPAAAMYPLDVADIAAVGAMIDDVLSRYGRIDVLVNNAGEAPRHRRLRTTSPADVQAAFQSNVAGTIYCCQHVVAAMRTAGSGLVINVASIAAEQPGVLSGLAYCAAKAAVVNLTDFLASEFRNSGIRFTALLPGEVDTDFLNQRPTPPSPGARAQMLQPEDVADAIVYVAQLPSRVHVRKMIIAPAVQRSTSAELEPE